ncbi:hypothetical protein FQN57_002152 [Myotisia sp. PD_48]|nr:hypothetical protein FQN57_002152 [Myotisia sp. PD_48]
MECLQDYDPTIPPLFITIATGAPLDHFQARASWHYTRPVLNSQALACQSALPRIQNIRGISYCGSWTGLGHLEDSVRSAFEVAVHHLGTQLPFEIVDASRTTRRVPKLGLLDMPVRVGINVTFISLCLLVLAKDILLAIVRSIIPVVNRAPPAANGNLGRE